MSVIRLRAWWQTAVVEAGLKVLEGGNGARVLLLLHGLGATGDVWDRWQPLLARRWTGRWLAPDLPGHGGSPGWMACLTPGIRPSTPRWSATTDAGG
jgi:pimeloyl-ACP methyl ester carboxylesterase